MSKGAFDLPIIHRGADYSYEFIWSWSCNDDGVVTEQIVDVTSYSALFQFRRKPKYPALLSLSVGTGITVDGPAGKFTVAINDTQTAALVAGTYEYDLVVTSPSGLTSVLVWGTVRVRDKVSQ